MAERHPMNHMSPKPQGGRGGKRKQTSYIYRSYTSQHLNPKTTGREGWETKQTSIQILYLSTSKPLVSNYLSRYPSSPLFGNHEKKRLFLHTPAAYHLGCDTIQSDMQLTVCLHPLRSGQRRWLPSTPPQNLRPYSNHYPRQHLTPFFSFSKPHKK